MRREEIQMENMEKGGDIKKGEQKNAKITIEKNKEYKCIEVKQYHKKKSTQNGDQILDPI